jgi:nucleoside-diphosphate-sugar epimerase
MPSLIIGSSGFIGSALRRYADNFLEEEYIGVTRNNYDLWKGRKYNRVIWAAGTSSKPECERDPGGCSKQNVGNLRTAIEDFECKQFIYISSLDVYQPKISVKTEGTATSIKDREGMSWYGLTKLQGEDLARQCDNYLILRCNGFTGPGLRKNAVYDLAQRDPQLFVSWDSRFQYAHTDKFAEILFALSKGVNNDIVNVTSPDVVTAVDVANILGVDLKKVKMPKDRIIPSIQAVMDVTKLENIFNKLSILMPSSREAILNWNKPLY